MNILFYNTYTINDMYLGLLLDEATRLSREGHQVSLMFCNGNIQSCLRNPLANQGICSVCKYNAKFVCKNISKKISVYSLTDFRPDKGHSSRSFTYSTIKDIKKLFYEGINIGYGALSTYVSLTRNNDPLIDETFRTYFDAILRESCTLIDSIEIGFEKINPDIVCFFNGRFYETRSVYELARKKGYLTRAYESVGGFGGEPVYKVVFENSLPHGIHKNQELMENVWNSSSLTLEEKLRKGEVFFEHRYAGIPAGDVVYTARQIKGTLPQGWDDSLRNIVIFNSSEDEFVAIGEEYDNLTLFDSQLEGIKNILEAFRNDTNMHFYLRVHPNLSNVKYKYHTNLYELENHYPNVTVIPAWDKVNSYDLMEHAEKIIVFGSTMGLESVYWGKPVVLLGPAIYYYSDICYIPQNLEELKNLLTRELTPKNRFEAIKWGFYFMVRENNIIQKTENSKFDYTPIQFNLLGKKLYTCTYNRILRSYKLMCVCLGVLKFIKMSLSGNKYRLPTEEQ